MRMVHCRAWSHRKGLPSRCNQAQIRSCTSPRGQDHFNQHAHRGASHSLHPLIKLIRCDQGYVIYEFTSDLFSRFSTPQPEKPPTNLVAIPEFHADDEAAHLITQEATFHQRAGKKTMPSLLFRTWTGVLSLLRPWKAWLWWNREDEPEARIDWFTSSEDDIREEVARIFRRRKRSQVDKERTQKHLVQSTAHLLC